MVFVFDGRTTHRVPRRKWRYRDGIGNLSWWPISGRQHLQRMALRVLHGEYVLNPEGARRGR
jgi:hypothetical protein